MANWPIAVLILMIGCLVSSPSGMATICPLTALLVFVFSGTSGHELLSRAAPNIATVLVVMSATQLAIKKMLAGGVGERLSVAMARISAHRFLRRMPAPMLVPAVFVPAAMILAMFLHNITAILVLTPLAISICEVFGLSTAPTLSAMLIASNLGGASMAFGDTPAIIQRELWGFSPATFAVAMLPRNLVVLTALTLTACLVTWLPRRSEQTDWLDTYRRLRARDHIINCSSNVARDRRNAVIGGIGLAAFIVAQFIFPHHSLVTASIVLAAMILLSHKDHRIEAYTTLGLDAILVIVSLFVVGAAVEHTPLVQRLAEMLKLHTGSGPVEAIAFLLTTGISADGSAATLAPVVHSLSNGAMSSAWQLACGICAGSSTILTAASAGPIINAVSREAGHELTFRDYAKFGLPFGLVMMVIYLAINLSVGR